MSWIALYSRHFLECFSLPPLILHWRDIASFRKLPWHPENSLWYTITSKPLVSNCSSLSQQEQGVYGVFSKQAENSWVTELSCSPHTFRSEAMPSLSLSPHLVSIMRSGSRLILLAILVHSVTIIRPVQSHSVQDASYHNAFHMPCSKLSHWWQKAVNPPVARLCQS